MKNKVVTILILMTMTTFINNLAHPVTPILVESIGYGVFLYGALFASMSIANFFMSPIWGRLSDYYGRKKFMVFAPIGYSIAQIGFGFSTNPYIIVLFRLLAGGIACGSFVAGMAYLVDVSEPKNRSRIITLYTALTGFAATIGNFTGGFIGIDDYHNTFITQGILSFISAFIILIVLKESSHKSNMVRKQNFKSFRNYNGVVLTFILLMIILTSILSTGFNIGFNSYMNQILGYDSFKIGKIMAITGVIGLITNIIIYPLLKRKFNDYYLLIFCIFMLFISLSLATYFSNISLINTACILILFFAFLALFRPLLQSILSRVGNNNGEIMGLNNASNAFGNVAGSLYVGFVFSININFTFYSLSIISLFIFILLILKKKDLEKYSY